MNVIEIRKRISAERMQWPEKLIQAALEEDCRQNGVTEQWYSQSFGIFVFIHKDGTERLMIHRMTLDGDQWEDGITWDELMEVKRQCGRGEKDFIEVFPKDENIINCGNVRHLWLVDPSKIPCVWAHKKLSMAVNYD